jgi:tripartite-type tricarboxylate transporter receptor subunit TctC
LTPVALIVTVPNVLVINPQVGARDVKELVAMMKSKPTGFSYASSGVGSTQHLAGEAFKLATGTQMSHVPYKGSAQAHLDLIAGSVQIMLDTTSSAMGHIKSGKLKALAVTSPRRSAELPDVPTAAEAGMPRLEVPGWFALFAPAKTPAPVIETLSKATAAAMQRPATATRLRAIGIHVLAGDGEVLRRRVEDDAQRMGELIRKAGLRAVE